MQKSVRYNEGHALYLSVAARKEGTKRGYLSKKTTENSRWTEKYFALYQNVLFYFENDQSARPSGIYLLEGCTCERAPAPKVSAVSKEPMEKQQVIFSVSRRNLLRRGGELSARTSFARMTAGGGVRGDTISVRNELPDSPAKLVGRCKNQPARQIFYRPKY
uniref:PH domain-containing protein n=1 Tax=Fundulus heteroclitus TaxID=8078 RepID=A0A3Q2PW64_FUNHE